MDELFSLFIQRISERMPELTLVDEDYGQLEAGLEEETYPVTFPCVLIGNLEADWENLTGGGQRGTVFSPSVSRSIATTIRTTDRARSQRSPSVC